MIRFLNKGLFTTVQDGGRVGYKRFGITTSGVMDDFSARLVNRLVGNRDFESIIEFTLVGPTIEFMKDGIIAVGGGDISVMINGKAFPMWKSLYIRKGRVLSFGKIKSGFRGYIAIQGGLKLKELLGSKSFDERIAYGFKIDNGTEIEISPIFNRGVIGRVVKKEFIPDFSGKIRVIRGPDIENFTEESFDTLFSTVWKVSKDSNRMGIRLYGGKIEHSERGANIESQGIVVGTIQVPESGEPIILMKEHQTTGGYARIGVVMTIDLYKLTQMKPEDSVIFEEGSLKTAIDGLKERESLFEKDTFYKEDRYKRFIMRVKGKEYFVEVEEIEENN